MFVEYFWYHWKGRSFKDGRAFVYAMEREDFLATINPIEDRHILNNKWETYNYFKPFYKRNVWLNGNDIDKCVLERGERMIFKPLDANCGRGVRIAKVSSLDELKRIGEEFGGDYLVEDLIIQNPSIGALHPYSVNTLRLNSCVLKDGSVFIFAPVLRIGCGGAVVDNAGAGGIIAALDKEKGEVIAVGDESCHYYYNHPDTNVPLIGFKVPFFSDAVVLVKEMAMMIPDIKLIGWDLALTDDGWVLVEANANPNLLWQIATKKGIREEFEMIKCHST